MDEITEIIVDLFTVRGKEGMTMAKLTLHQTLELLEEKLASSPSFHVIGQSWSLADVYCFMLADQVSDLSGYPRLQNFVESFHATMI